MNRIRKQFVMYLQALEGFDITNNVLVWISKCRWALLTLK